MVSNEEQFYLDIVNSVNPSTYDGTDSNLCLIGQYAKAKGINQFFKLRLIGAISGVSYYTILTIYSKAVDYGKDLESSLAMAREVLGLEA